MNFVRFPTSITVVTSRYTRLSGLSISDQLKWCRVMDYFLSRVLSLLLLLSHLWGWACYNPPVWRSLYPSLGFFCLVLLCFCLTDHVLLFPWIPSLLFSTRPTLMRTRRPERAHAAGRVTLRLCPYPRLLSGPVSPDKCWHLIWARARRKRYSSTTKSSFFETNLVTWVWTSFPT